MAPFKILLGGLSSSGKTELLNAIVSLSEDVKICHGSMEFMNWLGLKQGDYELLERISSGYKDIELERMINHLVGRADRGSICRVWMFSGHFGRIKDDKIQPAIGSWISFFGLLVLLTASPEVLVERILSDDISGKRSRSTMINLINSSADRYGAIKRLLIQTERIAEQAAEFYRVPLLKMDSSMLSSMQLAAQLLNHIRA